VAGLGLGWRGALALYIARRPQLDFLEVLAEDIPAQGPLPAPIADLVERGCRFAVHGVSLSLGSADGLDERALEHQARVAQRLRASIVSEHVCFVRAGGLESGHLLPVPRTEAALEVLVENVQKAQRAFSVPLALENIAALIEWPGPQLDEGTFLTRLLEATGSPLLLDASNLYANAHNFGRDARELLAALPVEKTAYVHVAGGVLRDAVYHDTHTHPLTRGVLPLLAEIARRAPHAGFLLERDGNYPPAAKLDEELKLIAQAAQKPLPQFEVPHGLARAS
jgi:uncharacterized protein (UPF0276 family)